MCRLYCSTDVCDILRIIIEGKLEIRELLILIDYGNIYFLKAFEVSGSKVNARRKKTFTFNGCTELCGKVDPYIPE